MNTALRRKHTILCYIRTILILFVTSRVLVDIGVQQDIFFTYGVVKIFPQEVQDISNIEKKYGRSIIHILQSYELGLDLDFVNKLVLSEHVTKQVRCSAYLYLIARGDLNYLKL